MTKQIYNFNPGPGRPAVGSAPAGPGRDARL